jgi:hypothetical protein
MNLTQIKNGQSVEITFGFGRTSVGQISDIVTNSFGTSYEVTLDDGTVEYVSNFNTAPGIGARLVE